MSVIARSDVAAAAYVVTQEDIRRSGMTTLPELFRLTPTNIRRSLKLNRPIYRRTAAYGHFGRAPEKDGGFSWEKTDLAGQLKKAF